MKRAPSYLLSQARAMTAPATTLVINIPSDVTERDEVLDYIKPIRKRAVADFPYLGAKTIVPMIVDGEVVLEFFQGLPSGEIDPSIEVCVNSATCGLAVARHVWGVIPVEQTVDVVMGGKPFTFEEASA